MNQGIDEESRMYVARCDAAPVPATATADDPMLADILAGDRHTPVARGLLPSRHVLPVGWIAGGTVAAVGVASVVVFSLASPAATPPAFADWTPQPNPNLTAAQRQQAVNDCESTMGLVEPASTTQAAPSYASAASSAAGGGATPSSSVSGPIGEPSTVIVDQRGSYHLTLLVWSDTQYGYCSDLTGNGGTISVLMDSDQAEIFGQDFAVFINDGGVVFGDGASRVFVVTIGRAGADVAKVQTVSAQGVLADASLTDGYWLVYGPIDTPAPTQSWPTGGTMSELTGDTTVIVTHIDGTTATEQVPYTMSWGIGVAQTPGPFWPWGMLDWSKATPFQNFSANPDVIWPSDGMTVDCEGGPGGSTASCFDVNPGTNGAVGNWVVPSPAASAGPALFCTADSSGTVTCVAPPDAGSAPH